MALSKTATVPKRVAPTGGAADTHRSQVLIRLPNLEKTTNQPPLAERASALAKRIDWRGKLPTIDWRRAWGQMAPATFEFLLRHPKVVAGATLLVLVQLTALAVMRDAPVPAVAAEVAIPQVELTSTPATLPTGGGATTAQPWGAAPLMADAPPGAPTVEIGAVTAVSAEPAPPNFVPPTMPAPPPGFGNEPIERMAQLPQSPSAPLGYQSPAPARQGVAELGGQIMPFGPGSQR